MHIARCVWIILPLSAHVKGYKEKYDAEQLRAAAWGPSVANKRNANWKRYLQSMAVHWAPGNCPNNWLSSQASPVLYLTCQFILIQRVIVPTFPNSVSSIHLNTRSLMDELSLLATKHLVDVITLSETWLDETIPNAEVLLPGYSLLRNDRNRRGDGVAIYISTSIRFVSRPDLKSNSIETLWIELFPCSKRSILICCAYRPPSQSGFFKDVLTECDLALSLLSPAKIG